MRFENNSLIGVLLKLPFRDVFRETPLFLPGPFRDSVVLRYFILFMKKSVNKCRKKYDSNRECCGKVPKGRKPFRFAFRETLLFLPGTFRDCGVLACSKTRGKHTVVAKNRLANN